jgi:hypothetical protein
MKARMITVSLLILLSLRMEAQSFSEKISKELSFEKKGNNAVMIFNINGNVRITGYAGDKVIVEVEKVIHGKTQDRMEKGKSDIQLGIIDRADTLILFVEGTCSKFGKGLNGGKNQSRKKEWSYQWNNNCNGNGRSNCQEKYDYEMNFTIKVPTVMNVLASTINDGDVSIEGVSGIVSANNINGSIQLKNISGSTNASTINGSVDLEYAQNPDQDCRYYSLNGDINAFFRKGLTANVAFESFNGAMYTNVDALETMPMVLEKKSDAQGLKYKIGGSRYKIGKGGILLDFETFNGNVYLKEKLN